MKRYLFLLLLLMVIVPAQTKVKRTNANSNKQVATVTDINNNSANLSNNSASTVDKDLVQELLNSFIENKIADRDASRALERMKTVFNKQNSIKSKNDFRDVIYNSIINYQKDNKNLESLYTIDAYQNFAEQGDNRLPLLYYIKGEISAQDYNDTITLKDCIAELKITDRRNNPKIGEYIDKLNTYLQESRNYIPVSHRLSNGIWISMNVFDHDNGAPFFVMYGESDGRIRLQCNGVPLGDKQLSQNETELMHDCAYIAWGSEELNVPSNLSISLKNSLSAGIGNSVGSALGDVIGSSFLGSIGGDFIGGIFSEMLKSEPKKEINICEATIHHINDFEIEANIKTQNIVVTQKEEKKTETNYSDVLFMRLSPEVIKDLDIMFFTNNKLPYIFNPDYKNNLAGNMSIGAVLQLVLMNANNPNAYGIELIQGKDKKEKINTIKKMLKSKEVIKQWNTNQLSLIYDYNEKLMNYENYMIGNMHNKTINVLGIYADNISQFPKEQKKNPNINGLFVSDISTDGTASIYGLKKGDIILSIDGFKMNSISDMNNYIQSLERFSPVKIQLLRKKKEIEIVVEHIGLQMPPCTIN